MKAKIDNYSSWIDRSDGKQLSREIEKCLEKAGFTILNFMDHQFDPYGYTAVWLLAESHCALHTFPEENKSYLELSSCNTRLYLDFIRLYSMHFDLLEPELPTP